MGRYIDISHNFAIYDVPKGGGTTIRGWLYFANKRFLDLNDSNGYLTLTSNASDYIKDIGYEICNFIPWSKGPSICIVRNPVDRFISLYNDKINKEKKCGNPPPSFSDFTLNFASFIKNNDRKHPGNPKLKYLEYHFAPQSQILGINKDYYEQIFDISEINTKVKSYLEKKWMIELPFLQCRKSKIYNKIIPNRKELKIIEELYRIDLSSDWIFKG